MQITGNGEIRGPEAAQNSSSYIGNRRDWAASASGPASARNAGMYCGETNPMGDLFGAGSRSLGPNVRAESNETGAVKLEGKFPR